MNRTPNTPANGGQILELREALADLLNWTNAEASNSSAYTAALQRAHKAISDTADLRASLAAPAIEKTPLQQDMEAEADAFEATLACKIARKPSTTYSWGWEYTSYANQQQFKEWCNRRAAAPAIPTVDRNAVLWTHRRKDGTGYSAFIYDDKERAEHSQVFNLARDNYELVGLVEAASVPQPAAQVAVSGMHEAADFIDRRAQKYIDENADTEFDTGAVVFHEGAAGRDYHSTLVELADDLRATPATVKTAEKKPLTRCAANRDGDCSHAECPQLRDNEPHATGRHCPIDTSSEDEQ